MSAIVFHYPFVSAGVAHGNIHPGETVDGHGLGGGITPFDVGSSCNLGDGTQK